MIAWIDRLLDKITMYRLTLYVLIAFVAIGAFVGALHGLPYGAASIILSALVLFFACWYLNDFLAWIFDARPSAESAMITALILALIMTPVSFAPFDVNGFFMLLWASVFAMASKYVLAINKKHIFNPAAIAAVGTGFIFNQYASWWVGGNVPMIAFVVIGGLLVVRKIRRFDLSLPFFAGALISIFATQWSVTAAGVAGGAFGITWDLLDKIIFHTPIFFFAFIMLTEPSTSPPTRALRIAYGALVGLLYAPAIHVGPVYSIPELALCVGNIFSFAASPKKKLVLALKEKREAGAGIYDFTFIPAPAVPRAASMIDFHPGQYMEWTLFEKQPRNQPKIKGDRRGNRRYFTIASSPTEPELHLGVKFYDPSSSFKRRLIAMEPGDKIIGATLQGDFTLPKNPAKKLVFVAGGIGITPFRSMVKYLSDRGEKRDIVLLYSVRTAAEIAYREVLDEAARKKIGLKTIYAVTGSGEVLPENGYSGRIGDALIKEAIPDYRERIFYLSGTHAMVSGMESALRKMGIPRVKIKKDFFPGFA